MIAQEQSTKLGYKVPEAAAAYSLSPSYLWRLVQQGQLPVIRIGRSVRIRRDDLEAFMEAHTTPAIDESAR